MPPLAELRQGQPGPLPPAHDSFFQIPLSKCAAESPPLPPWKNTCTFLEGKKEEHIHTMDSYTFCVEMHTARTYTSSMDTYTRLQTRQMPKLDTTRPCTDWHLTHWPNHLHARHGLTFYHDLPNLPCKIAMHVRGRVYVFFHWPTYPRRAIVRVVFTILELWYTDVRVVN